MSFLVWCVLDVSPIRKGYIWLACNNKSSPEQYRKEHDEESIEDGSNNLMSQLSALNMGKGKVLS
jgi:hypothetical protein